MVHFARYYPTALHVLPKGVLVLSREVGSVPEEQQHELIDVLKDRKIIV